VALATAAGRGQCKLRCPQSGRERRRDSDQAAGVTGQCIGLGGDKLALWSHPKEISVAFREGGWTADAIAEVWSTSVGAQLETYGIQFLGGGKS